MITLPLAKLSCAPDAEPEIQHFTWKHETHNLALVLEGFRAGGSVSQLLRVVQGTKNLVHCEVEHLINFGNEILRAANERGEDVRHDQLPISAIVRCPLLAIRWQLPNRKIRRVQLKFLDDQHFNTVYAHLQQLGLRMTSNGPTGKPVANQHGGGGPSCPPSRLAEISNRPLTAVSTATAPSPMFQSQDVNTERPASAVFGIMNAERKHFTSSLNPLVPPEYFARPPSATSSTLSFPSNKPPSSSNDGPLPTIEEIPTRPPSNPEPSVFPSQSSCPSSGEPSLPPRRELPFMRSSPPKSSGSDSGRPSSRPSTGIMGPPPVPHRSSPQRPNSSRTATSRDDNFPPLAPLPKPTIVGEVPEQNHAMMQPSGTPLRGDDLLWTTEKPATETVSIQPHPASSPASCKSSNSYVGMSSRLLGSPSQPSQSPLRPEMQKATPLPLASGPTRQYPTVAESLGRPTINSSDYSLAGYAAQSDEVRAAALSNFILRQLDNNEFLTLVEDMESCMARLALP